MANQHKIVVDGRSFLAQHGEVLLDAALSNGIGVPFECRSGHCGTCCLRLVSGRVSGGEGSEPDIRHACQCRIAGDAVLETGQAAPVRSVDGVLTSLLARSPDVLEISIRTRNALPYHAGQYVQVRFDGFPSRPYSLTHPLRGPAGSNSICLHVRRLHDGRVTSALGHRIKPGHPVQLTGPYGTAHFRANLAGRLILVGTNTGFAPIWSIAAAALRENPQRLMLIIAGARSPDSLYMAPALLQLARYPNVLALPVCSSLQTRSNAVFPGRPTDYLPRLFATDVVYACGAPAMVEAVQAIAAQSGATCYADPFMPSADAAIDAGVLTRTWGRLSGAVGRTSTIQPPRLVTENRILRAFYN